MININENIIEDDNKNNREDNNKFDFNNIIDFEDKKFIL